MMSNSFTFGLFAIHSCLFTIFVRYGSAANATSTGLRSLITPAPNSLLATKTVSSLPKQGDNVGKLQCYESWMTHMESLSEYSKAYYSSENKNYAKPDSHLHTRIEKNLIVMIQTTGPGTTYMACDGIPRFKSLGPPNATKTVLVTRTVTSITPVWFRKGDNVTSKEIDVLPPIITKRAVPPFPSIRPNCTLDANVCDNLWAEYGQEFGANPEPRVGRTKVQPLAACPQRRNCGLLMGEEVVMFYWPPEVTSRDICALNGHGTAQTIMPTAVSGTSDPPVVFSTTAITFRGKDIYPITRLYRYNTFNLSSWIVSHSVGSSVLTGDFTFTYPSVYLAHHDIRAEVKTWPEGPDRLPSTRMILKAGIIPLHAKDVFSIYPFYKSDASGLEMASLAAAGKFLATYQHGDPEVITAPFDFADLKDPVPASLYYNARSEDCFGNVSHCATITDDSYRPQISINNDIWKTVLPSTLVCALPVLVDPPIALTKLNYTMKPPTLSVFPKDPAAMPTVAPPGQGLDQFHHAPSPEQGSSRPAARPGDRISPPYPFATGDPSRPGYAADPSAVNFPDAGSRDGGLWGGGGSGFWSGFPGMGLRGGNPRDGDNSGFWSGFPGMGLGNGNPRNGDGSGFWNSFPWMGSGDGNPREGDGSGFWSSFPGMGSRNDGPRDTSGSWFWSSFPNTGSRNDGPRDTSGSGFWSSFPGMGSRNGGPRDTSGSWFWSSSPNTGSRNGGPRDTSGPGFWSGRPNTGPSDGGPRDAVVQGFWSIVNQLTRPWRGGDSAGTHAESGGRSGGQGGKEDGGASTDGDGKGERDPERDSRTGGGLSTGVAPGRSRLGNGWVALSFFMVVLVLD